MVTDGATETPDALERRMRGIGEVYRDMKSNMASINKNRRDHAKTGRSIYPAVFGCRAVYVMLENFSN